MIQTIRDAETKIWTLQKEVTYLKTKINDAENNVFDLRNEVEILKSVPVSNSGAVDSIVNSDGTEVSHRLYHIFQKLKVVALEVVNDLILKGLEVLNLLKTKDLIVTNDALVSHNLRVANRFSVDSSATVPAFNFCAVGPECAYSAWYVNSIAMIGSSAAASPNGIYFGCSKDAPQGYGFIIAGEPGIAYRPLVLNIGGAGIIMACPDVGGMASIGTVANIVTMCQSGTQLLFKVRDVAGTLRTGTVNLV